jgi:hypothetical protein
MRAMERDYALSALIESQKEHPNKIILGFWIVTLDIVICFLRPIGEKRPSSLGLNWSTARPIL